jgi:hypothetical protein
VPIFYVRDCGHSLGECRTDTMLHELKVCYMPQCQVECSAGQQKCPAGSQDPRTCAACKAGTYGSAPNTCALCPKGKYQQWGGMTSCYSCPSHDMQVRTRLGSSILCFKVIPDGLYCCSMNMVIGFRWLMSNTCCSSH